MNRPQRHRSGVDVDLRFVGCRADERMLELCLHTARRLGRDQQLAGGCRVVVTQRSRLAEIRIQLEATDDRFAVARLCPAGDEAQLHASLQAALTELTRKVDRRRHHVLQSAPRMRPAVPSQGAPPCIWYG